MAGFGWGGFIEIKDESVVAEAEWDTRVRCCWARSASVAPNANKTYVTPIIAIAHMTVAPNLISDSDTCRFEVMIVSFEVKGTNHNSVMVVITTALKETSSQERFLCVNGKP